MGSFKDEAKSYEPKTLSTLDEAGEISVDAVFTEEQREANGEEYTVNVYTHTDGKEYRVPVSVIAQLKEILAEKPDLKKFKVKKTGQGMNTKYQVITL